MRISLNWINDYVDIKTENIKEMKDKITNCGVNVERVEENNLNNLVVGHIIEVKDHPDSDHLHVCMVDILNEKLQIVCGARNVKEGIKVIIAKVGALLPGNFEIKKSTIRGVESNGMICALFELGLEQKTEDNYNKGIHILPEDAPIGEDAITYLDLDDTIFELDLNPNRSDCTNHLGFAYEAAAVLNKKVKTPETSTKNIKESIKSQFSLEVKTDNCKMYLARMVKDVKIGPSPDFIKHRLEACGMRSINNVVDISNYVMLEYGQPLHFFDKDKLGDKIVVRMAKEGECVTTLDEQKRVLKDTDIVITDGYDVTAIAGVMGALNTDVDINTKNVLIESAIFNPYNIRYTSLRLNLRSEASLRFEKELNYEYTNEALNRACYLLETYASGKVLSDTISYDKVDKTPKIANVTIDKINKVLGINVPKKEIDKAFNELDFPYTFENDTYTVTIPNRRTDVKISEDLIEEVGRLYGFDKIENKMPIAPIKKGSYAPKTLFRKQISKRLRILGLNEVKTYTLISEEESKRFGNEKCLKVLLPMSSDKSIIRTNLTTSLYKVYEYNISHSVSDINIYEIANVYHEDYSEELKLGILINGEYLQTTWQNNPIKADFYVLKGIIENLLDYVGYQNRYSFRTMEHPYNELHPGVSASIYVDNNEIGYLGKVHPSFNKEEIYVAELSLEKLYMRKAAKIKYPEISKYPEVNKDMAFILDNFITSDEVIKEIKKSGTNLLKQVEVFDLYKGKNIEDNKKSLAFSLKFTSNDRTLTEEEIEVLFNKIIDNICKKFNAVLRDK